jgi:predicted O-linked N-acetylglucosamine transferase (SPINDLY family)
MKSTGKRHQKKSIKRAIGRSLKDQSQASNELINLALQHHSAGRLAEAGQLYQQILVAEPSQPVALQYLGVLAHQLGKNDTAIDLIAQALVIKPDYAEAHGNLGVALNAKGRFKEAVASYRKATLANPVYVEAHYNLGIVLHKLGQFDEAIASYTLALDLKPDYEEALGNLGNVLKDVGRLEEATAYYRQVIAFRPQKADAHNNLGVALNAMNNWADAATSLQNAIALKPDYAEAHNNLGNVLANQGMLNEAVLSFRKSLSIDPTLAEAHNNLGTVLKDTGQLEEALDHCKRALTFNPNSTTIHSNMLLSALYSPAQTEKSLYDLHCDWSSSYERSEATFNHTTALATKVERRLNIGYVSPDLRRHSVSYFLEPILANHDPQAVAVHCYSNSLYEDQVTARLRSYVETWRNIYGVGDNTVAQLICEDKIDILIDLSGHTMANRLPLFSLKPAPVQVTYLGYPSTTGLNAIDYRLTDALADPIGNYDVSLHSEKLFRLKGGFLCYQPPKDAPEIGPAPYLKNGYITFGSCNNLAKITTKTIEAWAQILNAVPLSKILIKAKALEDSGVCLDLAERFSTSGIGAERLDLRAWISGPKPLSTYNHIDIALDTFPYNGTTTICEAHWMGVPNVTLSGDRHSGRVGHSLNVQVGLADWVASSIDGYVALAIRAANSPDTLSTLRRELRGRMVGGPLCDGPAFTRTLEAAYRDMMSMYS